jgi:hypothetical protein
MIDQHQEAAQRLADLLAQENAALKRLDFLAAVALVPAKEATLAALEGTTGVHESDRTGAAVECAREGEPGVAGTCHRRANADRPDCRPRVRADAGCNAIQWLWRPRTPDPRCRPGRIYQSLIARPCAAPRLWARHARVYDDRPALGRLRPDRADRTISDA